MNLRNLLAVSALAAGLAAVPTAASAAPSIFGPTGYILTPNAQVVGNNCLNAGWDYIDLDNPAPDFNFYKANLGLFDRLEVGGMFLHINGFGTFDTAILNAKASVLPRSSPFQLAGGVIDALDSLDRAAYVVGQVNAGQVFDASYLPRSLQLGAGWGTGGPIDGIFVNGGFMLGRVLELMGEWIDPDGFLADDVTNVGGRIHLGGVRTGLTFNVYALDVTDDDPIMVYGVSLTQCFGAKKKKHHEEEDYKGKDDKGDYKEVVPLEKEVVPAPPAPASSSSNLRSKLAANLRAQ